MDYTGHAMTRPTIRASTTAGRAAAKTDVTVDMCDDDVDERKNNGDVQNNGDVSFTGGNGHASHGHVSHGHGSHGGHGQSQCQNRGGQSQCQNRAGQSHGHGGHAPAQSQFYGEDDDRNLQRYKDRIRIINLNAWLRSKGIRCIPRTYLSELWFVKDCLGFVGCVFTWLLIVFGEIVFCVFILMNFYDGRWSFVNGVFSVTCAVLGFVAHLRAMFTDPVSFVFDSAKHL